MEISINAPFWMRLFDTNSTDFFLIVGVVIVLGLITVVLVIELARYIPLWLERRAAEKTLRDPKNLKFLCDLAGVIYDPEHDQEPELLVKIREFKRVNGIGPEFMDYSKPLATGLKHDPAKNQALELLEKICQIKWNEISESRDMLHINPLVTDLEIIKSFKERR